MKRIRLALILLVMCLLLGSVPAYALEKNDNSRIYFYNMYDSETANADFIIVESMGHFGLIDTGHRYSTDIQDARGVHLLATMENGLSSQVKYKNAVDAAEYMVNSIGITHLDFIVGTHSHSDHIGGVPEIANYTFELNGENTHLVDDSTVYFYKEYHHVNDLNDDLEEYSASSWHNQAFNFQAVRAMQKKNAVLFELSQGVIEDESEQELLDYSAQLEAVNETYLDNAEYNIGSTYDYYDDNISFTFGTMTIRLYNMFSHNTTLDENINSVVASITDGELHFVSLADINVEDRAEQRITAAIKRDAGSADLLKVAHHGAYFGSNSREMLDTLSPRYAVVTRKCKDIQGVNPSGAYSLAMYYAKKNFGTVFYESGASDFALVAEFNEDDFSFYNLIGEDEQARFTDAFECLNDMSYEDGWSKWDNEIGNNTSYDYYYFNNNTLYTGWLSDNGSYYYFDESGLMQTGWVKYKGSWYYLDSKGAMTTGWLEQNGAWYYLGTDGAMKTHWQQIGKRWYYSSSSGVMQSEWKKINGSWYYFAKSGAMQTGWQQIDGSWYYLESTGKMTTGWQKVGNYWYYMNSSGAMQTGWIKLSGKWYYLETSGRMRTASLTYKGKVYNFSKSGVCLNP